MKIGYARVSTEEQSLDMQLDALRAAGCDRVFEDRASGAKEDRPGLAQALDFAREGDELVVWRLDRVGRSLPHLVKIIDDMRDRGIGFRSVTENIETQTPDGRLVMHIFASLAEFERDLIRERTRSGLAAARARGRKGGRPPLSVDKIAALQALWASKTMTADQISEQLGIHRATVFKYTKQLPGGPDT
jgi:DNA invertase Pin-like site-specific DNA recombinase